MNNTLFNNAKKAASAGDFLSALTLYTSCLKDPMKAPVSGEAGEIYHQIGNCLVRLGNYSEAMNAYSQALNDKMYDKAGTIHYNLGQVYAILHDRDNALLHYQAAVSDGKYTTPYKAYNAMGSVLLKTGRNAEAGVAFREAALDDNNPDPTKSLLNLGVCFMALNRPADAVASYESALPFDTDSQTKHKLYANLGQAYVSTGQMKKAVSAFEQALADKTYFLSDSAAVDYKKAIGKVSQGTDEFNPSTVDLSAHPEAAIDTTDVYAGAQAHEDGLINQFDPAASQASSNNLVGLDVSADGTSVLDSSIINQQNSALGQDMYQNFAPQQTPKGISLPQENGFFNAQAQNAEWEKNMRKISKKRHPVLKFLLVVLIVVAVLSLAGVLAYSQGYGLPTQESVVTQLFSSPANSEETCYVSGLSKEKISSFTDILSSQTGKINIDGINRGMNESEVYVTSSTTSGGKITYQVSLSRDGIGWKVANVQLYFASQNQ